MRKVALVVVFVTAILLLTSCGKRDSGDNGGNFDRTALQVTEHEKSCLGIRDGQKIDADMIQEGCVGPDGSLVLFAVLGFSHCEFTTYDDRFYGEIGSKWHEVIGASTEGDAGYSRAYSACAAK